MDIEDFCTEPGLGRCVEEAISAAKEDPEGRQLEVYMSLKEPNLKGVGLGSLRISPGDTERRALIKAIKRKLLDYLGEEADGQLRLYFRCAGDTQTRYGTFSRTLRSTVLEGDGNTSRTIAEQRKFILQLMQTNVDQTNASANVVSANAETVTGLGEVIKGLNPQPTKWFQVVGQALAPVVAKVIQAKAKGQTQALPQGQEGKGLPPVNTPVKLSNGDRVMRLADGRWIKERGKEDWVYIDPPPEAKGAASSVPGIVEDNTEAEEAAQVEVESAAPVTEAQMEAFANENPYKALEMVKKLAAKNGISPDQVAEILKMEESIDA